MSARLSLRSARLRAALPNSKASAITLVAALIASAQKISAVPEKG
jgi:hypothetical protein